MNILFVLLIKEILGMFKKVFILKIILDKLLDKKFLSFLLDFNNESVIKIKLI